MSNHAHRPGGLEARSQSHEPPTRLGLASASLGSLASASASMNSLALTDLPSPRAGEVPPALSPLDALALQGRLLAKRFEQQDNAGRRLSRLAPLTVQHEFGNRTGYFASLSTSALNSPDEDLTSISQPRPEPSPRQTAPDRHRSFYPQFGSDDGDDVLKYAPPLPGRSPMAPIAETSPATTPPQGYFDMPRSHSPDSGDFQLGLHEATPVSPTMPAPPMKHFLSPRRKRSVESQPRSQPRSNLLPPSSAGSLHSQRSPRLSPSVRSVVREDSSDEVEAISLNGSSDSMQQNHRILTPSSSLSRAQSPFSPTTASFVPRSPSVSSIYSANGSQLPRPSYNFSRPMSRQSARPSIDTRPLVDPPQRQHSDESVYMRPSFESQTMPPDQNQSPITNYSNETLHTPVSMASEDSRPSADLAPNPGPTYTYAKFSLPRGRRLDRHSVGIEDFFKREITWDDPSQNQVRPRSPSSPPRSVEPQQAQHQQSASRDASVDRGASSLVSSNATIRGPASGAEITAQQHCDMGIDLHEKGQLLKSTYHLRLAARAGLPEAMFWYGLACRHGWGMRENKAEALQWLRRAVDSGQLEVAVDEDQSKTGQPTDTLKKKQHQIQYAVAIYELGKCYGNGWGAPTDKPLALRCYEIAANWGDADALVEAGYCYAEGVGCKKDMKKAAKFYRAAEAKGVSMIGNSWIYKDKYMDESALADSRSVRSGRSAKKDNSEKKARDKSRTRTMFSRKKSATVSSTS